MAVTWKQHILSEVMDYCNQHGSRTFFLAEFLEERLAFLQAFRPENRNVAAKVRQQLQVLRDEGIIAFVNNHGAYTLRNLALLNHERTAIEQADIWEDLREPIAGLADNPQTPLQPNQIRVLPEKRKHFVETYVRDSGWARQAKQTFGTDCLICNCSNRFNKSDGQPYIEVHHIIPLCDGGEDGVWNLSVLCAHHHRMAHFADDDSKKDIREFLLEEVDGRLRVS